MTKPIIGRYSNEQLRFTRHTGYKRSDFEHDMPRATMADVKFSIAIILALVIGAAAWRFAA
jgi:hypothetical protein